MIILNDITRLKVKEYKCAINGSYFISGSIYYYKLAKYLEQILPSVYTIQCLVNHRSRW